MEIPKIKTKCFAHQLSAELPFLPVSRLLLTYSQLIDLKVKAETKNLCPVIFLFFFWPQESCCAFRCKMLKMIQMYLPLPPAMPGCSCNKLQTFALKRQGVSNMMTPPIAPCKQFKNHEGRANDLLINSPSCLLSSTAVLGAQATQRLAFSASHTQQHHPQPGPPHAPSAR